MERLFADYEATSAEKLSNHVKIAALRKMLPAEMRVHVNMQIRDNTSYEDLKKAVTEYEVAERRYNPLGHSVYDYQGPVPMEVDQVQHDGKGKKGGKPGKGKDKTNQPACKTCGKPHKGECWYKGGAPASGAGKGGAQKGKGTGGTKGEKVPCQICGKTNHTADKCFQRYKDKDKDKGNSKGGKTAVQQAQDASGATVTGVSRQDADTSPESELRHATGGIRACTPDGRALILLDSGSDEHLCPPDFANWSKEVVRDTGPRLKDAQGGVIAHEFRYRLVQLKIYATTGQAVDFEVPFLIGPVNQPILSAGKLAANLGVEFKITGKGASMVVNGEAYEVEKHMQSFYLPCHPLGPTEDRGVRAVQAAKMMVLDGEVVKYRQRLKSDPQPLRFGESVKEKPQEPPRESEHARSASPKRERTPRRERDDSREDKGAPKKRRHRKRPTKNPGGEEEELEKAKEERSEESVDPVVLREAKRETLSPQSEDNKSEADYQVTPSSLEDEQESRKRSLEPAQSEASGTKRPRSPSRPPARRKDWSTEQKHQDNLAARQRKKARKEALKAEAAQGSQKGKGKGKGKHKGEAKGQKKGKGKGGHWSHTRAITFDGWACAAGEPPGSAEDEGIFSDVIPSPREVEAAEAAESQGPEEAPPQPAVAADEPRPVPLNEHSRVADLKARLKQLGAPVWGDKARLWERVQEYEARQQASAETEAILKAREEALNRDPTLGRQPLELAAPAPPSEVARRLHELTHLPYEPWCEACVRGRGKDLPHYGLQRGELDEARLRPMVCMDWFDVASSGEDGKRVEGTTVTLLLTDAETGYVAAIPSPSKGQDMYTHLTKMVVTFLKVMRHEKLKIRADQEPALKALIGMVKEQWPHRILVEESPLYSSQSNGRAERAI